MKKYIKSLPLITALVVLSLVPNVVRAESANYAFVTFETAVTRQGIETSDTNPEERRIYISNIVKFPGNDQAMFRRASKIADDYFIATIVDPMKEKGILFHYYDDAIRINDRAVYDLVTRADVEELRAKVMENLKEQNVNVFTFNWTLNGKTNGLETSQPALIQHNPEQPLYGASEIKEAVIAPDSTVKKGARKN